MYVSPRIRNAQNRVPVGLSAIRTLPGLACEMTRLGSDFAPETTFPRLGARFGRLIKHDDYCCVCPPLVWPGFRYRR